jgi:hypothetical protein
MAPRSEGNAAAHTSIAALARHGDNAFQPQALEKQCDGATFQVERKNVADHRGIGFVNDKLLALCAVPHRHCPAHPHPLSSGRRDLVPDPFGSNLALELGE